MIDVTSIAGRGSRFFIYLPTSSGNVVEETETAGGTIKGADTILLVDDEGIVIDVGSQMMKRLGYRVVTAACGKQAVEIYKESYKDIDLVILDMIMPEMSGFETYDRLKDVNPEIKVLLSSGYSKKGQASEIVAQDNQDFIQKPFAWHGFPKRLRRCSTNNDLRRVWGNQTLSDKNRSIPTLGLLHGPQAHKVKMVQLIKSGHNLCSGSIAEGSSIMRTALQTHRVPLAVTALIVVALVAWAWQDWRGFADHVEEMERHRALGVSRMLTGAIHALEENGRLERGEIEAIIEHIIRDSPYQFLVLGQNGKRILQAGDLPAALTMPSEETERFADGFYLFSRKVDLHREADGRKNTLGPPAEISEAAGLGIGGGENLMILGGDVRDHGYPKALTHLFAPVATVLLLLTASVAAWIMVIRSRFLGEQLRTERAHSAHLENLGLAAAGLAHETKNPLGIISGIAQQIARNPGVPEQSRVMIETIIDEVDKSAARLGHFMTFAKQRAIEVVPLDVRELAERIAEILQPELDAAGVTLTVDCPHVTIMADEDMLRQVLVNLLLNSLQASSEGGRVDVRLDHHGATATLMVTDRGIGISPQLLQNIFKPYVAASPDGHGLGLAIVKRFVEDHGWTIRADSEPGRGTVITISGIGLSLGERQ